MDLFVPTLEFFRQVINDPGVRPTVQKGDEWLDGRDLYDSPGSQIIAYEKGLGLFRHTGAGAYEGHVFCLPSARGSERLAFGKAGISWLFTGPQAVRLSAAAPLVLPAVAVYCRRLGLRPSGRDLFHEYFEVEASEWAV